MSHLAKCLPPTPHLTVCAGANWQHDLLERPGSTAKGEMAALGALGCWDMPQGPVFCLTGSLNTDDSGAAESESPCVIVCHPGQRSAPAPAAMPEVLTAKPAPQLCLGLQSSASAPCEESDRLSLTRSFTAPGFTNPSGFYNPLGCGGVCPGKKDSQNRSHF